MGTSMSSETIEIEPGFTTVQLFPEDFGGIDGLRNVIAESKQIFDLRHRMVLDYFESKDKEFAAKRKEERFQANWKAMNKADNPCIRQKKTYVIPAPKSSMGKKKSCSWEATHHKITGRKLERKKLGKR